MSFLDVFLYWVWVWVWGFGGDEKDAHTQNLDTHIHTGCAGSLVGGVWRGNLRLDVDA
jgi:hypothetical protein